MKPQLALIAPHGAEILQIRKKLFVEHISQDLRSILSVMVSFQPFKLKIKKYLRNNLIQHTRISSSLKINTFNGRCIKDLWWQACSKFQNQAKLIYLHQTYSKVKYQKCLIDMAPRSLIGAYNNLESSTEVFKSAIDLNPMIDSYDLNPMIFWLSFFSLWFFA